MAGTVWSWVEAFRWWSKKSWWCYAAVGRLGSQQQRVELLWWYLGEHRASWWHCCSWCRLLGRRSASVHQETHQQSVSNVSVIQDVHQFFKVVEFFRCFLSWKVLENTQCLKVFQKCCRRSLNLFLISHVVGSSSRESFSQLLSAVRQGLLLWRG